MEQPIDSIAPLNKVYKDKAFWVGTFLGGPLVAGYFFAENFKALNQPSKVGRTWLYTILFTIAIFAVAFLIPDKISIPNQVIPILYTGMIYQIFKSTQGNSVSEHLKKGGKTFGWGRVIAVSLIGLLITILPIVGYYMVTDAIEYGNTTTKTYGDIVEHTIEFDKSNITEQEVDLIADALIYTGFFDLAVEKYIYTEKEKNAYIIYIPVNGDISGDPEALEPFEYLQKDVDQSFPSNPVKVKLVVDYIENVVKVLE